MKSAIFLLCIFPAMLLNSCQSVAIRPIYEYTGVEVDFDGDSKGSPVSVSNEETVFKRAGLEVAVSKAQNLEIFADLGWSEMDKDDASALDGYEMGIGVRSQWPTEPGWGIDWSGRLSYFDLDDDETLFGTILLDREIEGYGITLKGGPHYAFQVGEEYIFSPHAGIQYNMKRGDEDISRFGTKETDLEFEYDSFGAYVGARFNSKSLKHFDINADLSVGSNALIGFMISAGIRF